MIVYVAGPYSAPTEAERVANVERAMTAAKAVLDRGHTPLVPLLNHWFSRWHRREYGVDLSWQAYLDWDIPLLLRADALLRLPGPSKGADMEEQAARGAGIVVYRAVAEIPDRRVLN